MVVKSYGKPKRGDIVTVEWKHHNGSEGLWNKKQKTKKKDWAGRFSFRACRDGEVVDCKLTIMHHFVRLHPTSDISLSMLF